MKLYPNFLFNSFSDKELIFQLNDIIYRNECEPFIFMSFSRLSKSIHFEKNPSWQFHESFYVFLSTLKLHSSVVATVESLCRWVLLRSTWANNHFLFSLQPFWIFSQIVQSFSDIHPTMVPRKRTYSII